MGRVKRKKPSLHNVIVDTNILWHEDKANMVSPGFTTFWEKANQEFKLKLIIPEVVKGELLYQQISAGMTTLKNVNQKFEDLSKIANVGYGHRITKERVNRDIETKFGKWIAQYRAEVERTPIENINWKRLIQDAIWRNPPFIEEKSGEKGFRDALILETVCFFCDKKPAIDTAFITGDRTLQGAVSLRLSRYDNFTVYESLEEFSSYLKMTKEKLTAEFVRAIMRKARIKFFNAKRHTGLLYEERVRKKIREKFTNMFSPPKEELSLVSEIFQSERTEFWESISEEKVFIERPRFDHIEKEIEYYWISPIKYVELFTKRYSQPEISFLHIPNERLRIIYFNVKWRSTVRADGRFYNPKVTDIKFDKRSFEAPNDQQLQNYHIRRKTEINQITESSEPQQ